ncbi:hypothetical protein [Nonomuraea sp. NPDC049750]|uniref:hypothetical protein n=1 Tax=Nonomuraea sp. NPDC049750 TaxID=3154738 RepID=UPI0033C3EC55
MADIGRVLGAILICTVLGMIGLALLKAVGRGLRKVRARVRGWRDLRKLRPYADELWPRREYMRILRGGDPR